MIKVIEKSKNNKISLDNKDHPMLVKVKDTGTICMTIVNPNINKDYLDLFVVSVTPNSRGKIGEVWPWVSVSKLEKFKGTLEISND